MKQIYSFIAVFLGCSMGVYAQRLQTNSSSEHVAIVFDYQYAPGQHALNYAPIANVEEIKEKFKGDTSTGYVLLGGWGGFISAGFDHSIMNRTGYDFGVYSQPGSGDEPGVVYVMKDENGNGQPDDTWYELEGNVVGSEGYIRDYEVTYFKPETVDNPDSKVHWSDNKGNTGVLDYAKWWDDSKDQVTFSGVKLPDNKENTSGPFWYDIEGMYTYGYAEVYSADDYNKGKKYNRFDISNAVDASGNKVVLEFIDFVKVQTGCFYEAGWLGEVSTEVSGAVDLNMTDFAATFDEHVLPEESEQYTDATSAGQYITVSQELSSGSFSFKNSATQWGTPESPYTSWYGVALSNCTDKTSPGNVDNQFNSAAGGDVNGTGTYGVVFDANSGGMSMGPDAAITFTVTGQPEGKQLTGCYVTSSTYATDCILNGNFASRPFGYNNVEEKEADVDGTSGIREDWFKLTAEGFDINGVSSGTLDFYLADYRYEDNTQDYIVEDWEWFDLSTLGVISKVTFTMSSSDTGDYGMNTPAYFCIDNINKARLLLNNTIEDVTVEKNADDVLIDLSDVFVESETVDITKDIEWNTNADLVTATVEGDQLRLSFAADQVGEAQIKLKGKSAKMAAHTTFAVSVTTSTDVDNLTDELTISLYPNPMLDNLTVKSNGLSGRAYKLINLAGQVVMSGTLQGDEQTIPVAHLTSGTYIFVVQTENGSLVKKVIKQ